MEARDRTARVYRYVTGINNFDRILRFDARDIMSDTNEVEYALVNRLYTKRLKPATKDCDSGMPIVNCGGKAEREPESHGNQQRPNQIASRNRGAGSGNLGAGAKIFY